MFRVAAAIPAYNAEKTLAEVLLGVSKHIGTGDIFVVDDGSADRTASIAREKGVWLLSHKDRRGKGASLRDAAKKILELSYDAVITLDSDLQHDPANIPAFISSSELYDVVIGNRMSSADDMPVHRVMSNSITSKLISIRTGIKVEDSQCGYRLYKSEVLQKVSSKCNHYDFESDILIKSAIAGYRIGFVPIAAIYNGSKSSIRVNDILRFMSVYIKSFVVS